MVKNIDNTNEISLQYLIFKVYFDYDKMVKKIKRMALKNEQNVKDNIAKAKRAFSLNPLAKSLAKKTTIEELEVYKYIKITEIENQTYAIITFYILMSYLKSFGTQYFRKLVLFKSQVINNIEKQELDFNVCIALRPISAIVAVIQNLGIVFAFFKKERFVNGS